MQYFPLFIDTQNCQVLLIGAGEVASRKLDLLTRSQAKIRVIAAEAEQHIRDYADDGRIELIIRDVEESDVLDCDLLYLATSNSVLNSHLAKYASDNSILVNVVDSPDLCSFITPSIVDRGKLVIAISTAGSAPVFARQIRARLETWLPQSLRPLLDFVAERRQEVQQKVPEPKGRRALWERFFDDNGDRYDDATAEHYQSALLGGATAGELLLIDEQTPIELLPILAVSLLQKIDKLAVLNPAPAQLMELVRRDASRVAMPCHSQIQTWCEQGERILIYAPDNKIKMLKEAFPTAKHLRAGAL